MADHEAKGVIIRGDIILGILNKSITLAAILSLSACSGFQSGSSAWGGNDIVDGNVISESDDSKQVRVNANSKADTLITGLSDSSLSSASMTIPQGALAIDATVTVSEGSSLVGRDTASIFGDNSKVSTAGEAAIFSASESVDATAPMTLQLPIPVATGLGLFNAFSFDYYVVVYRVVKASTGEVVTGVLSGGDIELLDNVIEFKSSHFGSFQVLVLSEDFNESKEVPASEPITKASGELVDNDINESIVTISLSEVTGQAEAQSGDGAESSPITLSIGAKSVALKFVTSPEEAEMICDDLSAGATLDGKDVSMTSETETHTFSCYATYEDKSSATIWISAILLNKAPSFSSSANFSIAENLTAAGAVQADDSDSDDVLSYSLTGGSDQSLFSIDSSSGALSFKAAPDFELPGDDDGDNLYEITVAVDDGNGHIVDQSIVVTVVDANDAPVFTSSVSYTIAENTTSVGSITGSDEDGDTLTFTIDSGLDSGLFTLTAAGALSFTTAKDYELPADNGTDNIYELKVAVDDGAGGIAYQDLTVTVTDANDAPEISTTASHSIAENSTATIVTIAATDADGDGLTYSVTGGDSSYFTIDTSGNLSFTAAADFESPNDAGFDNTYDFDVVVGDGTTSTNLTVAITVTDDNDAPVISTTASHSIAENSTATIVTIAATDADGDGLTYSVTGGDSSYFTIDTSGNLSFTSDADFESPNDAGLDNTYDFDVVVGDGTVNTNLTVAITVTDDNDAPEISTTASHSIAENSTATIVTIAATDADGDGLTYSVTGGDSSYFTIDTSGNLSFTAAADFESPNDAGLDNTYDFDVVVGDGTTSTNLTVAITVTDDNDAPVISTTASHSIAENSTATIVTIAATDADGDGLTYSVTGGDSSYFTIDTSGNLSFTAAADFESPNDAGLDNTYDFDVVVGDGTVNTNLTVAITVTDDNDAPVISTTASHSIAENSTATIVTIAATDADGDGLTYSVTGGDSSYFTIDTSGNLSFTADADFESPNDAGLDNTYDFDVVVGDGTVNTNLTVAITVTDDNDAPVISTTASHSIAENSTATIVTIAATDADGDGLTYSVTGGDSSYFTIDTSGNLSFTAAADFESPNDAGLDNTYDFDVVVGDGTVNTNLTVAITVTDANDAPEISTTASHSIAENSTATIVTIAATDADGDGLTYSVTGGDSSYFTIDTSGNLSFTAAADFESPNDAGLDNTYDFDVVVGDGTTSTNLTVAITVTDDNDAPEISTTASHSIAENSTATIVTIAATDADGDGLTYSVTGGDSSYFTIDTSGNLSFTAAADFESPNDAGLDNTYDFDVVVGDGTTSTNLTVAITVTDDNDAPEISTTASHSIAENSTATIVTIAATDADGDGLTYSVTGGDSSYFTIDTSGNLSFTAAADFESPNDAGLDNTYDFDVVVGDGTTSTNLTVAITVTDDNDAPEISTTASHSIAENSTATIVTIAATDADGDGLTYSVTGGDSSYFTIDTSGNLSFTAAADFESPNDAGLDNTYDFDVVVGDGTTSTNLTVAITVTDDNDAPVISTTASHSIAENSTATIVTIAATDADGDGLTYSVTGGDSSYFTIDTSGNLSFTSDADFESPNDAGLDNTYDFDVVVGDGTVNTNLTVAITVTDDNDAPVISTTASHSIAENSTATIVTIAATDADGDGLTYSVTGGDSSYFTIDTSGNLSFTSDADFESPNDAGLDNTYDFDVVVGDGTVNTNLTVAITVTDDNDAPVISTTASHSIAENSTATIVTIAATDADGDGLTYSVTGGDSSYFTIDTSGNLSFTAAADFESPNDAGLDNTYDFDVVVGDGTVNTNLTVAITVTDDNDAPVISTTASHSIAENSTATIVTIAATDADGDGLTYSVTGGDSSYFTIDTSGNLSFTAAADFESPNDAGLDNTYDFDVVVGDGTTSTNLTVAITVTDDNDAPVISTTASHSIAENSTATIVTIAATDADGDGLTYSVTGGDSSYFTIDTSGNLSFTAAADFESPNDAGLDNTYDFDVVVGDGTTSTILTVAISVNDLADGSGSPPSFTKTGDNGQFAYWAGDGSSTKPYRAVVIPSVGDGIVYFDTSDPDTDFNQIVCTALPGYVAVLGSQLRFNATLGHAGTNPESFSCYAEDDAVNASATLYFEFQIQPDKPEGDVLYEQAVDADIVGAVITTMPDGAIAIAYKNNGPTNFTNIEIRNKNLSVRHSTTVDLGSTTAKIKGIHYDPPSKRLYITGSFYDGTSDNVYLNAFDKALNVIAGYPYDYNGPASFPEIGVDLEMDPNGKVVIAATAHNMVNASSNKDFWVLKIDPADGSIAWDLAFEYSPNSKDIMTSMARGVSGEFYFGGFIDYGAGDTGWYVTRFIPAGPPAMTQDSANWPLYYDPTNGSEKVLDLAFHPGLGKAVASGHFDTATVQVENFLLESYSNNAGDSIIASGSWIGTTLDEMAGIAIAPNGDLYTMGFSYPSNDTWIISQFEGGATDDGTNWDLAGASGNTSGDGRMLDIAADSEGNVIVIGNEIDKINGTSGPDFVIYKFRGTP